MNGASIEQRQLTRESIRESVYQHTPPVVFLPPLFPLLAAALPQPPPGVPPGSVTAIVNRINKTTLC